MKKLITLIYILSSTLSFSQLSKKNDLLAAEVMMEDGSTKTGFLKDFVQPIVSGDGLISGPINIEKKLNLDTKEFKFQKTKDSDSEILNIDNIKSIIIYEDQENEEENIRYDKAKLKTVNSKYEIIDLNKTVMLPLFKGGKINLYGFFIGNTPEHVTSSSLFIPYLKKNNDEYAYIPLDINRINIFNLGSIKGKYKKAFEEVTKDCPVFQKELEQYINHLNEKKKRKERYTVKEEKRKDALKTIKNKEMLEYILQKIETDFHIAQYTEIIDTYSNTCQ
ncbi:hypothetical protein [Chryseobacterium fistulae]|uniref:Uncharacterized protein n=1 Tax=Chryseobacterium fistulae TaxID=2675058 RepID=A0A6N4XVR1_9FLAO|nr:hypothetical protein [Chryseobacterium fistulae]CAA7389600.1 hypothetical protein CHRY9393_02179 [Chryseobacterium fistulae]